MNKETPSIRIRQATDSDIAHLCSIDSVAKANVKRVEFITQSVLGECCWLIEKGDTIAGYGVMRYDFFDCGFISMLYLAESYRRQGLGRKMLEFLRSQCTTDKLFTSTNKSNSPAQQLLEQAGFRRSGIIENLDEGDPELIYISDQG